jgi:DNA repair protein RadC
VRPPPEGRPHVRAGVGGSSRAGGEPPPSSQSDLARLTAGSPNGHAAERKRGRLETPSSLETRDLLELLGGPPRHPLRIAADGDLIELARAEVGELVAERGLGRAGARRLAAAFELARRLHGSQRAHRPSVRSPSRVLRLLEDEVRGAEQERFFVLLLDGKHALRRVELVSLGTLTTSLVHPREVFRPAVRAAAAAVVCAHNHPSGDPEPSAEDVEVTRRLLDAGKLLGIPVLDHVVLGDGRYVSLRERMGF